MQIINVSTYHFVSLPTAKTYQVLLKAKGEALGLKGTILLGAEGMNMNVAGLPSAWETFREYLLSCPEFSALTFKYSYSDTVPFKKFIVRIKKEIVTMKEDIHPEQQRGASLDPQVLKQWLDEGRDIALLDARNQFEYEQGSFNHALSLSLKSFSEFPKAIAKLDATLKKKPIVTFCTGGIRCEKAVLALEQQGFTEVYQLAGGILNYFEQCGGAHYHGSCFVFDDRVALNSQLHVVNQGEMNGI